MVGSFAAVKQRGFFGFEKPTTGFSFAVLYGGCDRETKKGRRLEIT